MPPDPLASSRVCLASVSRPFITSTTQTTSKTPSPSGGGAPPPPPALEGHESTRSLVFSMSDAPSQTGARDGQAGGLGQGISRRDTIRVQRHHFGCCISDRRGGKDCRKKPRVFLVGFLIMDLGGGGGWEEWVGWPSSDRGKKSTILEAKKEGRKRRATQTHCFPPGFLHEAGAEGGIRALRAEASGFSFGGFEFYTSEKERGLREGDISISGFLRGEEIGLEGEAEFLLPFFQFSSPLWHTLGSMALA